MITGAKVAVKRAVGGIKQCVQCGEVKSVDQFYAHPKPQDGRMGKCILCVRLDRKNYRRSHHEEIRLRAHNHSKAAEVSPEKKEQVRQALRRMRLKYPHKARARVKVGRALRSGRIVKQPCSVCGSEKVEAHHPDYAKPLDIVWLCHLHHREIEGRLIKL